MTIYKSHSRLIGLLAELQARMSRSCSFCCFLPHTQLVSLKPSKTHQDQEVGQNKTAYVRIALVTFLLRVYTCSSIKTWKLSLLVNHRSVQKTLKAVIHALLCDQAISWQLLWSVARDKLSFSYVDFWFNFDAIMNFY